MSFFHGEPPFVYFAIGIVSSREQIAKSQTILQYSNKNDKMKEKVRTECEKEVEEQ